MLKQARSEGVAPVASRYSYELTQKSLLRSEINPSSRVDYMSSSSFFKKAQITFLIHLNNDF